MKKMRKGKKLLLIFIIAVIIIIATILIINLVKNKEPGTEIPEEKQQIIQLPETTYSNMEVKNINMQYLKDNDETIVEMEIHNTTEVKVEDEDLDAILIGPNEEVLGQLPTYIQELDVGNQYNISVIMKGDLTQATQIKLMKK